MCLELDDSPDATIQADVQQVADLDFAAEFGGAVHVVFPSWLFSQCTRSSRCISEKFLCFLVSSRDSVRWKTDSVLCAAHPGQLPPL